MSDAPRTFDAGQMSPLELIAAVNRLQGRETGPSAIGYVDEYGSPVVPTWEGQGFGSAQIEVPAAGGFDVPAVAQGEGVGEIARESGQPAPEPTAPPEWNLIELESGVGQWRSQQFTLAAGELLRVRRIVVAAIRRGLREQGRALGAEVAPRRQRKPKGGRRNARRADAVSEV